MKKLANPTYSIYDERTGTCLADLGTFTTAARAAARAQFEALEPGSRIGIYVQHDVVKGGVAYGCTERVLVAMARPWAPKGGR